MTEHSGEELISLRIITSAMAIIGILAACQLADTQPGLVSFGIIGTVIGSIVSYHRRTSTNLWLKWILAAGIVILFGIFIEEILSRIQATIADARAPLTNMLIGLQGLHCFDLPRRRDLNVSAIVGLTLLASGAMLSRDLTFGLYLLIFMCFGAYMLYLDCISRTINNTTHHHPADTQTASPNVSADRTTKHISRISAATLILLLPLSAIVVFALMPKPSIGLLSNVRVSLKLNLPFLNDNAIANRQLTRTMRADGSLEINPTAYFGFCKELDLNYRGTLSDHIVLRISSPKGEFWRGMAFDSYDGHHWTMTQPRLTFDRYTTYGSAIPLEPLPSMSVNHQMPMEDLTQVVYLEEDGPNLIPAASTPYLIHFPANKVEVDSYGSLRSPVEMEKDMVYTVISHIMKYRCATIREEPLPLANVLKKLQLNQANCLTLPSHLPSEVIALARRVAGDKGNWFFKAEKINYFLRNGYRYDLAVPPTTKNDDAVDEFLFRRKRGYCEHFASAFVVMCRANGIPSRLVTGFTPGEYNPFTGLWEVRMRDAHAWAEVRIPYRGWLSFDPTPGGAAPGFESRQPDQAWCYMSDQIISFMQHFLESRAVQELTQQLSPLVNSLAHNLGWFAALFSLIWLPLVWFIVTAVLLGLTFKLLVLLLHRVSQAEWRQPTSPREAASQEFLRMCRLLDELGVHRHPSDTADELSVQLQQRLQQLHYAEEELPELFTSFLKAYNHNRFGRVQDMSHLREVSDNIQHAFRKVRHHVRGSKGR